MPNDAVSPTPVVIPRHKEPDRPPVHVEHEYHAQPIQVVKIVHPVQPVIVEHEYAPNNSETEPETIPETIRREEPKQFGKEFPKNSERIPEPELFAPAQPAPQANITPYKKKGKPGRQRKYEETGNHGEIPVREVVLFRHIKGRHWPGMSQDMREWYDFYYFSRPKRTEKAKDAEDYARHCKSWERGQHWIADYEASQGRDYTVDALGDSRKIVAYRKRASS